MYPALKQQLEQRLGNIAFITKELAEQCLSHLRDRCPAIDVGQGEFDRQQPAFIVDDQMQLETIKLAYRVLAPFGHLLKQLVRTGPFGVAHDDRRRVDKADTDDLPLAGSEDSYTGKSEPTALIPPCGYS